jgi:hypothetical protein
MGVVVTAASGFDLDYVWRNQGQAVQERTAGGYYIDAAQDGEPPGRWWGPGAEALGFRDGQIVERDPYDLVYQQIDPKTGARLGRSRGNYADFQAHLERLKGAEPHATAERLLELEREAAQATRQAALYTDMTVSFSKSISVLHASMRENARRARLAGNKAEFASWEAAEADFQEILQAANRAGLAYVQRHAGITRTGYHGTRVDGREPGRFEEALITVTSWLQGTSRDGDPQDHIHNQIARIVQTVSDGKHRVLDTVCLRQVLGAVQAVVATHAECALTRRFAVEWLPRPDGCGNEIAGVTQEQMDAYSSRTVTIKEELPAAVAEWTHKYGRAPNRRQLAHIAQEVTMASRRGKREGEIDWDALCAQWDAKLGGDLASIAPRVSDSRATGRETRATPRSSEPDVGLSREGLKRAVQKALALVQEKQSTWTRADLLKQLGIVLPVQTRSMEPDAAVALLQELADVALSGEVEQVVCLEAAEWPPVPGYLRRELDGRSVYTRPGTARYGTRVQLSMEEKLLADAQTQSAPHLTREHAAQLVGADVQALDAQLRERAQEASTQVAQSGLRLDQAASLYRALTSPRAVEVIVGPAGSGKTRTLAEAARAWIDAGIGPVIGIATAQAARNVLASAGVQTAENSSVFLGHLPGRRSALGIKDIPRATLLVIDEASMMSMADLAAVISHAVTTGAKVLIAGDQEQLAAVESGGGMMLLARRLGFVQLAEAVRFKARWERYASLRLRAGQMSALDDYHAHGRIRGGDPDAVMDDACRMWVAHYLAGRDVLLMVADRARGREASRRIREDLIHLGLVADGPEITLREGEHASVGDLIICRENDHRAEAGEPGRTLANGDVLRIEAITDGHITVRRLLDCDPQTGSQRWTEHAFSYEDFSRFDLAYAVTGHSAQGRTVTVGIPLVTGTEDRQWLYVAMTRGTEGNHVFAFTRPAKTADAAPGTRPAPELERHHRIQLERQGLPADPARQPSTGPDPRDPVAVVADVLDRDGAEESALETQRRNLANTDHLAMLNAQWTGETTGANIARYRQILNYALPEEYRAEPLSPQATWLWRTLRSAETAGFDPHEVVEQAVASRSLTGARDVASVIDARIRLRVDGLVPLPQRPWSERIPDLPDPDRHEYVAQLAKAMDARKERIGEHLAEYPPAWADRALGPVPANPLDRLEWEHKAADIGAYRELYNFDHPDDPIGPEPTGDSPEKRAAWHAAFAALGPIDGIDLRSLPDGTLLHMRDTYAAETAWAPCHVGRELRQVRLSGEDAALAAIRADAEANAARRRQQAEVADRHATLGASYRAMADVYGEREIELAQTMDARREWELATTQTRHLAISADSELRRRHPHQRHEPVRSAEPVVSDHERKQLELTPGAAIYKTPKWITRLAEERRAFQEKLDERRSVRIPSEDPQLGDEGEAWPTWIARDRDAILQPPKPEMKPSPEIAARAAEPAADREAST